MYFLAKVVNFWRFASDIEAKGDTLSEGTAEVLGQG